MRVTTFKRVFFLLSTAAFTFVVNGALTPAKAIGTAQTAIASQQSSLKSHHSPMQATANENSLSSASAPSNILEVKTPPSVIFTSAEALGSDLSSVDYLAQQKPSTPSDGGITSDPIDTPTQTPRDPDSGVDEFSNPLPDTNDSNEPNQPSGVTTDDQQFDTPTQTPRDPNSGVDEFNNPLPETTDTDETTQPSGTTTDDQQFNTPTQTPRDPDAGVDEFNNPLPETTDIDETTQPGSDEFDNSAPDTTTPDDSLDSDTTNPGLTPEAVISPGRATRSGPSYIGVGGNIGLGSGDTAVGEGAFAIISKIGLTNYLSLRPSVLFSDDPTFLIPLTFDFIPGVTDVTEDLSGDLGLRVSPYIGGGVALSTGDDTDTSFLITGGVDVPLQERISANASVNFTLGDETAIGLVLGVGYNF